MKGLEIKSGTDDIGFCLGGRPLGSNKPLQADESMLVDSMRLAQFFV